MSQAGSSTQGSGLRHVEGRNRLDRGARQEAAVQAAAVRRRRQRIADLMVRYDPGSEVPVHFHDSDYCSLVVDGSIEITRKVHEVGSVRIVKAGTAYGPLKVGPQGCTVIDIFAAGPQGITYLGG